MVSNLFQRFVYALRRVLRTSAYTYSPKYLINLCRTIGCLEYLNMSVGELISFSTYFIALAVVAGYYYPRKASSNSHAVQAPVLRTLGELNFANLAFLLLPVSKHSLWLPLLGISFEKAVKFHRFIGMLTVIVMGVHGFGMWIAYATSTSSNSEANLNFVLRFQVNPATGWSNLSGFICFCCALAGISAAYIDIRRFFFEYFYYFHIICAILMYSFAQLHMPTLKSWMVPTYIVIGIDLFLRYYNFYFTSNFNATLKSIPNQSKGEAIATKVMITLPNSSSLASLCTKYEAGQYYFLSIPDISVLENHPFSVSCALNHSQSNTEASVVTFHCKNMGNNSWTKRLNNLATSAAKTSQPIPIVIDGPYGGTFRSLRSKSTIALICGGIGVTPAMSMLQDIIQWKKHKSPRTSHGILQSMQSFFFNGTFNREDDWKNVESIYFVWSARGQELFDEFSESLKEAAELFGEEHILLYDTMAKS